MTNVSIVAAPVIKRILWDRDKLPASELEQRLNMLRDLCIKQGLAGIFVYGDALYSGDLCYFTNYTCHISWRDGLLFMPAQGDPVMYLRVAARDVPYIQEVTPVKVKFCRELSGACLEAVEQFGVSEGPLGKIGFENIPFNEYIKVKKNLPIDSWADLTSTTRNWRVKKSKQEQLALKEGGRITSEGMALLKAKAVSGTTLPGLRAEVDYMARRKGCQDIQVLAGINEGNMGPVDDYTLKEGDYLRIILSIQHLQYWTSMARTVIVRKEDGVDDDIFVKVKDLENLLIQNLNPAQFDKKIFKLLKNEAAPSIGMGSGIGLQLEEEPDFLWQDFMPEEGMALNVRVTVESGGKKALRGDTVLLVDGQPEILTQV